MATPSELQTQLKQLDAQRDDYRYDGTQISSKTLTVLVAPSAVGKSTIITEVLRLCKERGIDAGEVGTLTTRKRRSASDPANYRTADEGITHEWMIDQISDKNLVNWSLSPTGDLYGTSADSFANAYNFLPVLPSSIPMLERAGFKEFHIVYITAPAVQWAERLDERRNDSTFAGRVHEAVSSLEFARHHIDSLHVVNNETTLQNGHPQPTGAAEQIIGIATGEAVQSQDSSLESINEMLVYAQQLLKAEL
jgi:guanylate kinase